MVNRRVLLNRTPHKPLVQPFTPGKSAAGGSGYGMRRSISTPSLAVTASTTKKPPTTAKRKLKS